MANYLGTLVKQLRQSKGYSQERLGREAMMSTSHICKIESYDTAIVGPRSLAKLAKILGVERDLLYLLAGKMPDHIVDRCRGSLEFSKLILWLGTQDDEAIKEVNSFPSRGIS